MVNACRRLKLDQTSFKIGGTIKKHVNEAVHTHFPSDSLAPLSEAELPPLPILNRNLCFLNYLKYAYITKKLD